MTVSTDHPANMAADMGSTSVTVCSLHDVLSQYPSRNRLLSLLYPDDLNALNDATRLRLTDSELRRYTNEWYSIPVSTVS